MDKFLSYKKVLRNLTKTLSARIIEVICFYAFTHYTMKKTKFKASSLMLIAGVALVSLGGAGFAINLSIQGTQTVVSSTASTS
jgi:branched-subunit amino acid transport protein AzlD